MFSVTYEQLNVWLTAFLWPFVRILALMATAPAFGDKSLPTRVKVALAGFITLIVAPTIGALPQVTVFSAQGVWIIVNQFLIGAALVRDVLRSACCGGDGGHVALHEYARDFDFSRV